MANSRSTLTGLDYWSSTEHSFGSYLRAMKYYSEVLYALIWKDFKLRFRHKWFTLLSIFLQPVISTATVSFCFWQYVRESEYASRYPAAVFIGLVIWQFAARSMNLGGTSLRQNSNAMSRVYFPRILLPVSAVVGGLVDLGISLPSLVGLLAFNHINMTIASMAQLGFYFCILLACCIGLSILFCLLDFEYDDISFMMPFVIQLGFFLTPIAYFSGGITTKWKSLLAINPLFTVIEGSRAALLKTTPPSSAEILLTLLSTFCLLFGGVWLFFHYEKKMGDKIDA